jgi:chaperone modulatory protein CbpM
MTTEQVECIVLDSGETVTLTELALCCEMSETELDELVDYCALVPLAVAAPQQRFSVHWVSPLRAADKLRLDFDLDLFTVAMLLGHLKRIDALERQLEQLRALLPARLQPMTAAP